MTEILSIDPGMSTGLIAASVKDDKLPEIRWKEQIEGGLPGLLEIEIWEYLQKDVVICESFHPRQMARSYKLNELEPLRIEGYLVAHVEPVFRQPEQRKLIKGDDFIPSARFLEWAGYWTLPSELPIKPKDADDANSAMMHLFSYLRSRKHRPTVKLLLDYQRSLTKEGSQ